MFTRKTFYRFAAPISLSLCIPMAALAQAKPSSGAIGPANTAPTSWTGSPSGVSLGESTCVDGTTCDVYTLTVTGKPADYVNKLVSVSANWTLPVEEYDVFVHQGSITGPVIGSSISGTPGTKNTVTINPNITGTGIYVVHIAADSATPGSSYVGTASISYAPVNTAQSKLTPPTYQNLKPPAGLGENSGEPSIGANWNTGSIMSSAVLDTLQLTMDTSKSPAIAKWTLRNNTISGTETLDPILYTDHTTGRTFDSQLAGTTSLMAYTDNDGLTWNPTQGGGIASGVDHQTVGGGPFRACTAVQAQLNPGPCAILTARGPLTSNPLGAYPNAIYYASQDIGMAQMALSQNGGITFELAHPMYTLAQCGGLHGHVKVGPDGTVFLPNKS